MEKMQTLRGFRDILYDEAAAFRRIEASARRYLTLFGFREIEVPILERTELFVRTIGEATDIVEKEMFSFRDLGGDAVTMRPEATAGVVRAYLQSGLYAKERVSRLFTIGPMFRHEKPQKGRFREFRQIDVEVFGVDDPLVDAELLYLISLIADDLGVSGYTMEVNSVGCPACRPAFRDKLVDYLGSHTDDLCEDCLRRRERNPLRVFDCKNSQCIEVGRGSPLLYDLLCQSCRDHFSAFCRHLDDFRVPFTINKRLVRGLDYYTRTVFEVTSEALGAQKTFIAGGRYENLVGEMGGPETPGTGFAIGVERLALVAQTGKPSAVPSFFFAYLGGAAKGYVTALKSLFTAKGLSLYYGYDGKSLKSQMRYADSLSVNYVLILGDDEIARQSIIVRNMADGTQAELPLDLGGLSAALDRLIAK